MIFRSFLEFFIYYYYYYYYYIGLGWAGGPGLGLHQPNRSGLIFFRLGWVETGSTHNPHGC
jgi:hypothetical protein